jgi:outer membrane protein OmpA-like peptidoglycan-associated protein
MKNKNDMKHEQKYKSQKKLKTSLCLMALLVGSQSYAGVFVGFGLGHDRLNSNSEANKNGFDLDTFIGDSLKSDNFNLDLALGFQSERLAGGNVSIHTDSLYSELAARVNLSKKFSIGPIAQVHFWTDNTRSEVVGKDSALVNLGLQTVLYAGKNYNLFASGFKSISGLNDRDLYSIKFGVQFNLCDDSVDQKEVAVYSTNQYSESIEKESLLGLTTETFSGFKTGSAVVDSNSSKRLKKLALYLKENKVSEVKIVGFADSMGSADINFRLSLQRADAIKSALVKNGVNPSSIKIEGKGFSNPVVFVTKKEKSAENRRVDVIFKDQAKIAQ